MSHRAVDDLVPLRRQLDAVEERITGIRAQLIVDLPALLALHSLRAGLLGQIAALEEAAR